MEDNTSFLGFLIPLSIFIIALLILGIILRLLLRGGGLLGVALATLASILLLYWISDVMQQFKKREKTNKEEKWDVDVIEDSKDITVVAKIPRTSERIALLLKGRTLQVKGEKNLNLDIPLKDDVEISSSTFKNRVLLVKLRKIISEGRGK